MRNNKNVIRLSVSVLCGAFLAFVVWGIVPHVYTGTLSWVAATAIFALQINSLFNPKRWPLVSTCLQSPLSRLIGWFNDWWLGASILWLVGVLTRIFVFPLLGVSVLFVALLPGLIYVGRYVEVLRQIRALKEREARLQAKAHRSVDGSDRLKPW